MKGIKFSLLTLSFMALTLHTRGVCEAYEKPDVILTLDASSTIIEFDEEMGHTSFKIPLHVEKALPKLSQKHLSKHQLWKSLQVGNVSPLKLPRGQNLSDSYTRPSLEPQKQAAVPFFITSFDPLVHSTDHRMLSFPLKKASKAAHYGELEYTCHNKPFVQSDFFIALGLKTPHVLSKEIKASYHHTEISPKKEPSSERLPIFLTFVSTPISEHLHEALYELSDTEFEIRDADCTSEYTAIPFQFSPIHLNVSTTTPVFLAFKEYAKKNAKVFFEKLHLEKPLSIERFSKLPSIPLEYISRSYLLEYRDDQFSTEQVAAFVGDKIRISPKYLELCDTQNYHPSAIKNEKPSLKMQFRARRQRALPYYTKPLSLSFEKFPSPTLNVPTLDAEQIISFVFNHKQLEFIKKKSSFIPSATIYVKSLDPSKLLKKRPLYYVAYPVIEKMLAKVHFAIPTKDVEISSQTSIPKALENHPISLTAFYLLRPCSPPEAILKKDTPFLDIIPTYAAKQLPPPSSHLYQAIASLEHVHLPEKASVRTPIFTDKNEGSKAKFDHFSPSEDIYVAEKEVELPPVAPMIKEEKLIGSAQADLKHHAKVEPNIDPVISPKVETTSKSQITPEPLPNQDLASISKEKKTPPSFFYSEKETLIDDQYLASGPQSPTKSKPSDLVEDVTQLHLPEFSPPSGGFADSKAMATLQKNEMTPYAIKEFDFEITPPAMQPSRLIKLSDHHLHLAFEPEPFILRENYEVETSEIKEKRRTILQYLPVNFDEFQRIENLCFYEQFRTDIQTIPRKDGSGYLFSISLYPLNSLNLKPQTQNYIFVIDQSRSVDKNRFNAYIKGVMKSLRYLKEGDTFNVLLLKSKPELLSTNSLAWNKTNLAKARKYLSSITYNPIPKNHLNCQHPLLQKG